MKYTIIITQNCNLACLYSYEHIKADNHLKEEMIPRIIQFIKRYQKEYFVIDKKNIAISINGGEALLNLDTIIKLVTYCKKADINIFTLSTNLTLANYDILDLLHSNGIYLHISIDGLKEVHDKNRVFKDGTGTFHKVYKNIKYIRERYPSWNNSYNITITPETAPFLHEGVRLLTDMGIRNIYSAYCTDYDWNEESLQHFKREMRKIVRDYIEFYLKGERIYFKLLTDNIRNTIRNGKGSCGICKNEIAIMPNGDLLPCGTFVGQREKDNYVIGSLKDYINFERVHDLFFSTRLNVSECNGCDLQKLCHIDCYAINYRVCGSMYSVPDCCCSLNQICLLEAEHIIQILSQANSQEFIKEFSLNK